MSIDSGNTNAVPAEQVLVEAFKHGDMDAFDGIISLFSAKLYKTAYALLGSRQDAEEVVQDTFLRAYRGLNAFRGDSSLETWLHRITVNLARNRYHWNQRHGEGVNVSLTVSTPDGDNDQASGTELELPDSRMEPDRKLEQKELEQMIMTELNQLPPAIREVMLLRHLDDMPYEDIAEKLHCKLGTVKSRLARGRDMLRAKLSDSESI